jgi:hypothetical protein
VVLSVFCFASDFDFLKRPGLQYILAYIALKKYLHRILTHWLKLVILEDLDPDLRGIRRPNHDPTIEVLIRSEELQLKQKL